MVRGRSVNVALPETRELIRQREYRARKAARISELENENARLREQNQRLLQELESMKQSGSGDSKSQMDGVKMQGIVVDEVKEQLYLALAKLHSISSSGRPRAPPPLRHYDQQPCGSTSTPTRWPEDDRKIPTAPAPVSLAPSHSDTPLAHLAEAASCCMGVVDCNPHITPMSNIAASTNLDQIQPSQPTFPTRHEFDAAEALRLSTRTIDETKCCLGLIDCDDM